MLDEANEKLREGLSADGDPVEMEIGQTDDGLTVKGKTGNYRFSVSQLVPVCVSGLIKCAALLTIFVFLLRLSDAFRVCDTPFDEKVIKRMMTFAWVLLGGAIIMGFSFTGGVSGIGIYSRLGGLSYTVRFAPAIISLVVLFLTVIFRYGAKLQKEADETL